MAYLGSRSRSRSPPHPWRRALEPAPPREPPPAHLANTTPPVTPGRSCDYVLLLAPVQRQAGSSLPAVAPDAQPAVVVEWRSSRARIEFKLVDGTIVRV